MMRPSATARSALLAIVILGAFVSVPAQPDEPDAALQRTGPDLLDAVRDDLVELRFEKALTGIAALLGDPAMSEADRAEALVLRAQAHVAFGDLDGAEADYREILAVRPGFTPEPSLTPRKAMERFERVQSKMIGHLVLDLRPADAVLTMNGFPVVPEPDGTVSMLVGDYVLRAERDGFDLQEQDVSVLAGKKSERTIRMIPNARTVILHTVPDGVEVLLDGVAMGRTERTDLGSRAAARIVLENLPPGDHTFELTKPCYRTETLREDVSVDLMDYDPLRLDPVHMIESRSTLTLAGELSRAEIVVDRRPTRAGIGEPIEVCAGDRLIDVRQAGRVVFRTIESIAESEERVVPITPRPNLAILGEVAPPPELDTFIGAFNLFPVDRSVTHSDLSSPSAWGGIELPPDTDIALGVAPPSRDGARERWYLFSPILRVVHPIEGAPADPERPTWWGTAWGFTAVDSRVGGAALVVEVAEGGPAAVAGLAPGARVVSVGGSDVKGAGQLAARLGLASASRPIELRWLSADGETHQAELQAARTPRLLPPVAEPDRAAVRAAWAVVDAICFPERAPSAQGNLALLLSAFGHHDLAVETWRRVRWGNRTGVGEGTTQYYLGRELEALGREAEAVKAYRQAVASGALTFDDEGPEVGPAARDRLADLGVK